MTTYDFSTIVIKDYPIDIACEVFTRINTGGKTLTLFEIMVAMTYDDKKGFDLAEKYEELIDGTEDDDNCLAKAKFDTIPESTVMQAVAAVTVKSTRAKDILKLKRDQFVTNWEPTRHSLFMAVDFIRTELQIPVSQLLPYNAVLVPLTYFFYLTKNKKPSRLQNQLLEQFFYWGGHTMRYSSSADSKISEDLKTIGEIAKNKQPHYPPAELYCDASVIRNTWFGTGNAFCKTILCLLASQQPKSFDTSGLVILDNSNLKIASSRNFHHFFPKDYLKKKRPDRKANCIANITLIDAYSNKHTIGAKAPSTYIQALSNTNAKLKQALRSHLIYDVSKFGILDDDYDQFLDKRSSSIADKLNDKFKPELGI